MQEMILTQARSMAPYQPNEYRVNVMVRSPVKGPKVAIYAGAIIPRRLKNKMVRKESHQPMKNNPGPKVPSAKVLTVKLADALKFKLAARTKKLFFREYIPDREVVKRLLISLLMRQNSFNSSLFTTHAIHEIDALLQIPPPFDDDFPRDGSRSSNSV
jgi:hypothetical protein